MYRQVQQIANGLSGQLDSAVSKCRIQSSFAMAGDIHIGVSQNREQMGSFRDRIDGGHQHGVGSAGIVSTGVASIKRILMRSLPSHFGISMISSDAEPDVSVGSTGFDAVEIWFENCMIA